MKKKCTNKCINWQFKPFYCDKECLEYNSKKITFEKQMLEKYPNLYNGESCYICKADLRYLHKIHRIKFEWYCHKCYMKHIFPNFLDPTKRKSKNETLT